MRVIYRTKGTDLSKWAAQAAVRTPIEFSRLTSHASKIGATNSKLAAPIYNKAKWSQTTWKYYRNHNRIPGGLRRGIRPFKTKKLNIKRYRGGWVATSRYASFVNDGFRHSMAKRMIPPRAFMEMGEIGAELYLRHGVPLALARIIKP